MSGHGSATRLAVVGSGPSAFYASEAVLRADAEVCVDMLERLPTPFGLVRAGVAPDHPKIKQVSLVYDRIARTPRIRFLGNITVGKDVSVEELQRMYHAVIFAHGADCDWRLGIPGEDLPGSIGAAEFVGWYNGHPDHSHREFDLSHEVAVIIGHGNVAADLARMLATPVEALASTDITSYAAEALARSRIRHIHIIGRRGPAQAKFTTNELRELGEIPGCDPLVDLADLALNDASAEELEDARAEVSKKNLEIFRQFAANSPNQARSCRFRFMETPLALNGGERVESVTLSRNRLDGPPFQQVAIPSGEIVQLPCGIVFRSVGFRGLQLPGLPFDEVRGIVPNYRGRVVKEGVPLAGLYVVGWIKRGASGIIGTNRADSVETVKCLLEDLPVLRARNLGEKGDVDAVLASRAVRVVDYGHWMKLNALETDRGRAKGKPREKFTNVLDMLDPA